MNIKDFSKKLVQRIKDGAQAPILDPKAMTAPRGVRMILGTYAPPVSRRDQAYEDSDGISECLSCVRSGAPLVLISGRAGTGKSRFIRYLGQIDEGRRQIIVAPTGVAALNIGAATIHKTFQLPFGALDARKMERRPLGRELEMIDRLVIDEISMVRADILDAIDMRMRERRGDPRPFGGVQVVMVGDFLQLPPVTPREEEAMLARLGYHTPYAFSAKVVNEMDLKVVTLSKVWRQSDRDFIEVLGRIRSGRARQQDVGWLNDQCFRPAKKGTRPLMLTPTRNAAQRYNETGINNQRSKRRSELQLGSCANGVEIGEHVFEAIRRGSFEGDAGRRKVVPVPDKVSLLPGVRIMAVKNDPGGKFVNGSLGTVLAAHPGQGETELPYVDVQFDDRPDPVSVGRVTWEEIRHRWNSATEAVEKEIVGSYTQIPLALGYAVTIHKSQGLTLTDMRLDLGNGTFAPGMLYVALSRAKSMDGLSFARPVRLDDMRTDEITTQFLAWARESARLEIVNDAPGSGNQAPSE
ncbi:AAA family ATPase [Leisingera aquaemixtae]|uniref:AAA family ATPase n=1 Tax=Leisingera aquaemixtae TaxID=1396826 RepID=A0ABY5WEN6_9RHOB|nr:AAA family ATPase [Leisingera aquaemixtae]UWQ39929.1 AAA family ATPase [Leisingera aquaemixtae]